MPRLVTLIQTEIMRGKGVDGDPIREVIQYWCVDGEHLMAEYDPFLSPKPPEPGYIKNNVTALRRPKGPSKT